MKLMKAKIGYIVIGLFMLLGVCTNAAAWTCKGTDWLNSECCPQYPTDPRCATTPPNNGGAGGAGGSGGTGVGVGVGVGTGGAGGAGGVGNGGQGGAGGVGLGGVGLGGTGGTANGGNATGGNSNSNATGGNSTSNANAGANSSSGASANGTVNSANKNSNSLTGGAQSLTGGSQSLTGGAQSQTGGGADVDTSNHSVTNDNSRFTVIPSVIPPTPASVTGIGNMIMTTTACGPYKVVVKTPVNGVFFGYFTHKQVVIGNTYDLDSYYDPDGKLVAYRYVTDADGSVHKLGSQAVIMATVVSIAGARNIALGGGGSKGDWGQGGAGASSSMTELVTNIQVFDCEIGTIKKDQVPQVDDRPPPEQVERRRIHE